LVFFCSAASIGVLAQAQEKVFIRQFGTPQSDYAASVAVYGGAGDNVYVAGSTDGKFPGQAKNGQTDVFVRKYSGTGVLGWTRQFGTPDYDSVAGVAVDATGLYVVGTTWGAFPGKNNTGLSDVFIRKYDAAGKVAWTRQFGTADYDWAGGVAVDASGLYVVGTTGGALPGQTSSGEDDVFVRKYNASGDVIWTRQFGSASWDAGAAVSVDANFVYVAGGTDGSLPDQINAGMTDAFVRKYDANGNLIWTRQFGGDEEDSASSIAVKDDSVYVAGIWQDYYYEDCTRCSRTRMYANTMWPALFNGIAGLAHRITRTGPAVLPRLPMACLSAARCPTAKPTCASTARMAA